MTVRGWRTAMRGNEKRKVLVWPTRLAGPYGAGAPAEMLGHPPPTFLFEPSCVSTLRTLGLFLRLLETMSGDVLEPRERAPHGTLVMRAARDGSGDAAVGGGTLGRGSMHDLSHCS